MMFSSPLVRTEKCDWMLLLDRIGRVLIRKLFLRTIFLEYWFSFRGRLRYQRVYWRGWRRIVFLKSEITCWYLFSPKFNVPVIGSPLFSIYWLLLLILKQTSDVWSYSIKYCEPWKSSKRHYLFRTNNVWAYLVLSSTVIGPLFVPGSQEIASSPWWMTSLMYWVGGQLYKHI